MGKNYDEIEVSCNSDTDEMHGGDSKARGTRSSYSLSSADEEWGVKSKIYSVQGRGYIFYKPSSEYWIGSSLPRLWGSFICFFLVSFLLSLLSSFEDVFFTRVSKQTIWLLVICFFFFFVQGILTGISHTQNEDELFQSWSGFSISFESLLQKPSSKKHSL